MINHSSKTLQMDTKTERLDCENPPVASSNSAYENSLGGSLNTGALCWQIEQSGVDQ